MILKRVFITTMAICLWIAAYAQQANPYKYFDSLSTFTDQSLLLEKGSMKNNTPNLKTIFILNLDSIVQIRRYTLDKVYVLSSVYSKGNTVQNKIIKIANKLSNMNPYSCKNDRGVRKNTKRRSYDFFWRYQLVMEDKAGEIRFKMKLNDKCQFFTHTILEGIRVKKLLRLIDE